MEAQDKKAAAGSSREKPAAVEKPSADHRKLGDEWVDWNGRVDESGAGIETDQRVFIGFAFLCLVFMIGAAFFTYYMISPRLEGWHHLIAAAVLIMLLLSCSAVALWFAAITLPIVTGTRFNRRMEFVQKTLNFLVPMTVGLGCRFGISRDRMGNSFIKVSNALVRTARLNTGQGPLLVLLPRCLTSSIRKSVKSLCERYGCLVFTVPGGELARQLIRDHKPSRIIAVACERDLVSGIQDVAPVIPTYAIPNCRPEGPCKNTVVDLKRIEEALILFNPPDNS
ncbi:MAG: DUF116 domain-containing protein [Gemmatimonadota bacterium]|nr:DUF116 domain-containing protein [Gemmatimonadota bacterium]